MSVNFLGNPKFPILKAELGNVPDYVVMGVMECIWERCHQNVHIKQDGLLPTGWGPAHIAALAGWDHDPNVLIKALTCPAINLIEQRPDGRYSIHDYADHVPEYVRKRWSREGARAGSVRTPSGQRPDNGRSGDDHPASPVPASPANPPVAPQGAKTGQRAGKGKTGNGKAAGPDQIHDERFQAAAAAAVTVSQQLCRLEFDARTDEGCKRIERIRWMLATIWSRPPGPKGGPDACDEAARQWEDLVRSKARGDDGKVDSVYATASAEFRRNWGLNGESSS